MYSVGQSVYDTRKNTRVTILDVSEIWGETSYKIFDSASDEIYRVGEKYLSLSPSDNVYNEYYLKYVALLSKIKNEKQTGKVARISQNIIPLPHQIHALNRVTADNTIRYILADEVGLGKTIEAGLIIKELKARGLIKRILVVCPTGLVTQWQLEMQDKFDEKFNVILPGDFETIKRVSNSPDIYSNFSQVISPMDAIKPLEKRAGWSADKVKKYNEDRINAVINAGWDLIIIDEAHRVAGSSGEVARHKLGKLLSESSPYLLLLTATPHNGKSEPFLRLIRLLDADAFPNVNAVVKSQVAPYVIRTEKRDAIDNEGNKLFKNRITKAVELHWEEKHSQQRKLYELVTEYVSTSYNKAQRNLGKNMWVVFLLIMMQRLVTSSTHAIKESMEKRVKLLESDEFRNKLLTDDECFDLSWDEDADVIESSVSLDIEDEIKVLKEIINAAKQAEFQYPDVKVDSLLEIMEKLFLEDKNRKIILFTEFIATQDFLKELLNKQGYTVSILNGTMNIDDRNRVLTEFREKTNILISTDAGGEGLNLQFSNCLINYDLPWNPMKLEQRIGRVDRIGQKNDVLIFNFILADTIENRVREVLEKKLAIILAELGIDKYSDVLDNETAEINFTDAYMNSLQNSADIDNNLSSVENDIREQIQNTLSIKDLIHEEKDLKSLLGSESTFDFELALQKLIDYYNESHGVFKLITEKYSLTDSEIIQHLKKDLEQDIHSPVFNLVIQNMPYEKGYFMLWQLSLSSDSQDQKTIPIFINDAGIIRPIAGQKLWDAILDYSKSISVRKGNIIDTTLWENLTQLSKEHAYGVYSKLKTEREKRNEEQYKKYQYALKLRRDAAKHIGIENIRNHKLASLIEEEKEIERKYLEGKEVCPEFKPVLVVHMDEL